MRFSILVAIVMMAQAAMAGDGTGLVEGEQLRRRRPAPPQEQAAPPPPAATPPPAQAPVEEGYDEGQDLPPQTEILENREETVIENQQSGEGVAGEFYTPGYGGLPQNWSQGVCQTVFEGRDSFTGAPLVNIIATDGFGRRYRTLPAPMPVGPGRINLILAFNGLIRNGVCPGPLIPQPVLRPQWGYAQPPVFLPYQQGVRRAPVPLINPQMNYNRGVYRPVPGYGRPYGNAPIAVPPMQQLQRPYGR